MVMARRMARELAAKRMPATIGEAADAVAAPAEGSDGLDRERLLALLMELNDAERTVVMLRHFDGHEVAAIARIMGESVGTVTKRLSRGHARLRERMQENGNAR